MCSDRTDIGCGSPACELCPLFPQCSLILTSDVSGLSANRLRSIKKYQTPVVGVDYVSSCLQRGVLLPVEGYRLDASPPSITKSNLLTLDLGLFLAVYL